MQIAKAFLFGKQISAGEAPMQDNVFFENGVFTWKDVETGEPWREERA